MRSAASVGRIGGLAIALGIGTAVATGYGIAAADSTGSSSGSAAAHSTTHTSGPKAGASRQQRAPAAGSVRKPARMPALKAAPAATSKALAPKAFRTTTGTPVNDPRPAPVEPAPLWGLVSWARRATAAQAGVSVATTSPTANVTSPVTTRVGWVTGPGTVTPSRFGIAGTDVGIMWDNGMTGEDRQVLMIFGDTFSGANQSGVWRSNVLLRTTDPIARNFAPGSVTDPFAGSPLSGPGMSRQVIKGSPSYLGLFGSEVTVIPTAAISVPYDNAYGARQYVNFMSVRSWDFGGAWTTNYSAIAYSDDNGQKWTVAPQTIRAASWLRSRHGTSPAIRTSSRAPSSNRRRTRPTPDTSTRSGPRRAGGLGVPVAGQRRPTSST